MAKRYAVTLASEPPLACRVAMLVAREPAPLPRFTEPIEVLVAARELAATLSGAVRGIAASEAAHALLADANEPTASAWQWLLAQIGLRSAPAGAFVAAAGAASRPASDRSMIALSFPVDAPGVYSGAGQARTARLFDQDAVVVGRMKTCDIATIDATVSRKHGRFVRRGSEWILEDFGSAGGIYRDDYRVHDVPVTTGDALHFGALVVEVVAIL